MSDWFQNISDSDYMFVDDFFYLAFPSSRKYYTDKEIQGEKLNYPKFEKDKWSELQREEFEKIVEDNSDSAKVIRWVGSERNRMEICYVYSSEWYFICQQDEKFFSVAVIGAHPCVICNDFNFGNSDGSTSYSLSLDKFVDPQNTLNIMLDIADDLIEYQKH